MEPILNFAQLTAHLKKLNHRKRIAVVCANDPNTEIAGIRNTATGKLARLSIPKIPVTTQYVKVTINRFKEENPLINQLQVSSQDDPPVPPYWEPC